MSDHRPVPQGPLRRVLRRVAHLPRTIEAGDGEGSSVVLAGSVLFLSCGFFGWVAVTAANDPTFFERQLLAGMSSRTLDPVITGSTERSGSDGDAAMPVPSVVRDKPVLPEDYVLVSVFEAEAVLAAGDELWRVTVGSTLPGLGAVLSIDTESGGGGTVRTDKATLRAGR